MLPDTCYQRWQVNAAFTQQVHPVLFNQPINEPIGFLYGADGHIQSPKSARRWGAAHVTLHPHASLLEHILQHMGVKTMGLMSKTLTRNLFNL